MQSNLIINTSDQKNNLFFWSDILGGVFTILLIGFFYFVGDVSSKREIAQYFTLLIGGCIGYFLTAFLLQGRKFLGIPSFLIVGIIGSLIWIMIQFDITYLWKSLGFSLIAWVSSSVISLIFMGLVRYAFSLLFTKSKQLK